MRPSILKQKEFTVRILDDIKDSQSKELKKTDVGRVNYEVSPLRGKPLNAGEGTHNQIMNNTEIQHIKQILGLKQGKAYTSTGELHYELTSWLDNNGNELIWFSRADNERSIPNDLDGFQRKILYICIKNKYRNEIKVSPLAGAVLAEVAYHHDGYYHYIGSKFVGSNNINVLHGVGQFSTRSQGSKDATSARELALQFIN
ncbi:DNA topoisomerase 2-beta [Rhizophagus clarus]|uniref:DNA topoisomerase (ATP-hydrolyzing) n=1 Tax=Rhizophagus clarus TaxID=94130 RepID=A0A8H3LUL6_9GLOM|nr:DNA topoisomerase 2-beta [Rhizophagus clarus]